MTRFEYNSYFLKYGERYWKVCHKVDSCACLHLYYSPSKCFRQKRERQRGRRTNWHLNYLLDTSLHRWVHIIKWHKETDGNLIIEYITRQMNGIVAWDILTGRQEMDYAGRESERLLLSSIRELQCSAAIMRRMQLKGERVGQRSKSV